jgi:hypothetical protein
MKVLRRFVAGCPSRRPGFHSRPGHVGFLVDDVGLRQYLRELRFPLGIFIPRTVSYSSYHRYYIVLILTASLNNQLSDKKEESDEFHVLVQSI